MASMVLSPVMLAALAVLVFLILWYIFDFYKYVRRFPRGPLPLPLIGNFHQVTMERMHLFFEDCYDKYGDVFTVWTPRPMVVIMEHDNLREALLKKGDFFLGRHDGIPEDVTMVVPNGGVTFAEGDSWRKQRRVALAILREFGVGRNIMEAQVRKSTDDFIAHVSTIKDKSRVDFRWPIQIYVANMINQLLFGYEYSYTGDWARLMRMADLFTELCESSRSNPLVLLAMHAKWVEDLPWIGWKAAGQYREIARKMHEHIRADVDRCLESFNEDSDPECFVHAYVREMRKDYELTIGQLINVCVDFFLAGMETTSTTLRWSVLFLARHQHVQKRMRSELLSVTGGTRPASLNDRAHLPYSWATMLEIQRVANIIPQNIAKRTLADVEIAGKLIPADTLVQTQFYSVHRRGFSNGDEFLPERFLNDDGTTLRKEAVERLNPFGLGKRQCAGEGLARMELFLGITSLVSSFHFDAPLNGPLDLEPINAIILVPPTNLLQIRPVYETLGQRPQSG